MDFLRGETITQTVFVLGYCFYRSLILLIAKLMDIESYE